MATRNTHGFAILNDREIAQYTLYAMGQAERFLPTPHVMACYQGQQIRREVNIGYSHTRPRYQTWFHPEFVGLGCDAMRVAPICCWQYHHRKQIVKQVFHDPKLTHIWQLTEQYDDNGYRLGVWPD